MILRADFGWIILVGFAFWLLQVLRAGASGRTGRGVPLPPPPSGEPGGTQREGAELEQLLRHLQRRLGQGGAKGGEARTDVAMKAGERRPFERPLRSGVAAAHPETSVEDRDAEALVRQRLAVAAGQKRELSNAGTAGFPAKVRAANEPLARVLATGPGLTTRQLRSAVIWREILGPPKGLQ